MSRQQVPLPTSLGRLLRFWRNHFDLSQEELALALDSSTRHISRMENGRVHPSREVVLRIAGYLGLKRRDTCNLLIAGGYIPKTIDAQFRGREYRWLRRTMAMNLGALDPYPAMLTDGQTGILMCNKSWLGMFHRYFDLTRELCISDYFEAVMQGIADGPEGEETTKAMCALALSIKQEGLMRDHQVLEELVLTLEKKHQLPDDWPTIAAKLEPRMSFPLFLNVNGEKHEFLHLSNGITSLGPVENAMEPLLLMIKLFPRNPATDLSGLADHDLDHPSLYTHEIDNMSR